MTSTVSDSEIPTIVIRNFGIEPYQPIFDRMQQLAINREPHSPDEFWILQHEPVFTLGRNASREHLLAASDIPVVPVDRGGQVTYHGPGQLVIYVLIDMRRKHLGVRPLVSAIEHAIVELLADYGIKANADPKAPGVYVEGKKIAALGLRVKNGTSYHGLSLNVDMDLEPFSRINPCGYQGLKVVQLKDFVPDIDISDVATRLVQRLLNQLGYNTGD